MLDVDRSLGGRRWRARPFEPRIAKAISQELDAPELIGRLLAARGVSADRATAFMTPRLRDVMPDPSALAGMDAAAERIADAVVAGERIAILADYDVDGACSAALLHHYLQALGHGVRVYIPDRLREGYGPNLPAMEQLAGEGAGLVLTVDCGTVANAVFEPLRGQVDIVVLDHHQPGETLPEVAAVVNPNRADDLSGLGDLAAVGVVFMTCVAVSRVLRGRNAFASGNEPDLLGLLDLVALGTVCDVVPLTGLNRAFVAQGLKALAARSRRGVSALCDAARIDEPVSTYHLGFVLGPRINAGGRVGRSDLGYGLLVAGDDDEAGALAGKLERLNRERRDLEASALAEARAEAELVLEDHPERPVLLLAHETWHPGIVGLVAARLKDAYRRPAFALAIGGDGLAQGSGRALAGVDLGAAVRAAGAAGLTVKGGGHAMAAGLTVADDRIAALADFFENRLAEDVAAARAQDGLSIDGLLTANGANETLMRDIERVGPFGSGNPEPRFAFPAHRITHSRPVGQGHLQLSVTSGDGGRLRAIAFRVAGTPLGETLAATGSRPLHLAGKLKRNHWQGRSSIQLIVDDAALPQ